MNESEYVNVTLRHVKYFVPNWKEIIKSAIGRFILQEQEELPAETEVLVASTAVVAASAPSASDSSEDSTHSLLASIDTFRQRLGAGEAAEEETAAEELIIEHEEAFKALEAQVAAHARERSAEAEAFGCSGDASQIEAVRGRAQRVEVRHVW